MLQLDSYAKPLFKKLGNADKARYIAWAEQAKPADHATALKTGAWKQAPAEAVNDHPSLPSSPTYDSGGGRLTADQRELEFGAHAYDRILYDDDCDTSDWRHRHPGAPDADLDAAIFETISPWLNVSSERGEHLIGECGVLDTSGCRCYMPWLPIAVNRVTSVLGGCEGTWDPRGVLKASLYTPQYRYWLATLSDDQYERLPRYVGVSRPRLDSDGWLLPEASEESREAA